MLIDTHSHCYFDVIIHQIEDVITRMGEHTVRHAVQIGCDLETTEQAIDLAHKFPGVFSATVGLHPESSQEMSKEEIVDTLSELENLLIKNKDIIVAIGECGFDNHYLDPVRSEEQKSSQRFAFEKQAELANKYNLPLVIHSRDAREETLFCLKEYHIKRAVMHCYSEDYEFALKIMEVSDDIFFSFSGNLTYKSAINIQHAARLLPLDRILIETDAPFLSPQAMRGRTNEPGNVGFVLDKLVELRDEKRDVIEQQVYENSRKFYNLV